MPDIYSNHNKLDQTLCAQKGKTHVVPCQLSCMLFDDLTNDFLKDGHFCERHRSCVK